MASWKLGTRTRGIALRWTLVVVAVGCSNSGGTGVKVTTCAGSGLVSDPTGHGCTQPQPPIQGCPAGSFMGSESTYFTTSTPPFEAEMKVAVDPRPNQNTVFVATIQTDTGPSNPGAPTATCVTAKHIAVYKSDGNGGLVAMTGLPAAPAHEWATDPNVAVGSDGTFYLSFLRWIGPCGLATSTSCNACSTASRAVTDVEIWFAPPGSNTLLPGLGDDVALDQAIMATPNSSFPAQLSAIPGTESGVDHPFIAVNPAVPGQLVVYVSGDLNPDVVYTLQKNGNAPGALSMSLAKLPLPTQMSTAFDNLGSLFVNPAFDASGALYLAIGELIDASNTAALHVQKYTAMNGSWQLAVDVTPPVPVGFTYAIADPIKDVINVPSSTPAAAFLSDPTPAIAVGTLNGSSDPVVYVAFEVTGSNGVRQIALEAANGRDVTQWTTPVVVPIPSGASLTFHPSLSLDTTNNALDLVEYALKQVGPNNQLSNINLNTYLTRFDAARLQPVFSPLLLNRAAPPLSLLPSRPESTLGIIFAGDYSTVATKGLNAFVAWPELGQGPVTGDLGFAEITGSCTNSVTLVDPDSLWECSCQCGSGEFNFVGVVGCAPASATTVASACSSVCTQNVLCGTALSCPPSMVCSGSAIAGQVLSTQSCAVSDGPPTGAAPASTADFLISGAAASQAVMTVAAAQPIATPVTGQAFFNASTSPPIPGAVAEIARLAIQPADFFLGGSVNAFVRNVRIAHKSRLRGTFTDATHFQIPAGAAELIVTLQTQPTGGTVSAPVNLRAANSTPLTGTLDVVHNTFTLNGIVSDSSGDSLALNFTGNIASRPTDANHNGIIDAVDKCPAEPFGPDRTPPTFTSVPPAITISSCTNANIGQAIASDPCGVTVTNNAPARFPLGTTTVTWTATDGAGNVATVRQAVTAVLGNDASCCPAGTHVIMGTSNNDVLTGTSGADCILGLGGQDTISGGDGDDVISGGDGDDVIYGQNGNDRIYGGTGQDTISGGAGSDFIDGGDGVDQISGDDGNDVIYGGQGGDVIHGGTGNDFISGGPDDDQLYGDDGNDQIYGDDGNDSLFGAKDNDVLSGGSGDDKLDGGLGVNTLDGGAGHNICVDNNVTLLVCPEGLAAD